MACNCHRHPDPGSKVNESYAEGKYPVNDYFQNYYIAASKHVMYRRNEFGFHLTYRYFTSVSMPNGGA